MLYSARMIPSPLPNPRAAFASLVVAATLLVALTGCAGILGDRDPPPPAGQPTFYENLAKGGKLDPTAAASMISGYRRNNGLGAVSLDSKLMAMAEVQARTMAVRDKMDHDVGGGFQSRLRASGYDAKLAAENIGAGYHTLAEAFSGWRDSPGHRANMLKNGVTQIGIAAYYTPNSKYKVFWALVLAAPDDKPDAVAKDGTKDGKSKPAKKRPAKKKPASKVSENHRG